MSEVKTAVHDVIRRLDAKEITYRKALSELVDLGVAPTMAVFLLSGRGGK